VSGLTNESENALPLNEKFWEHADHLDFDMVIKLSEDKYINILTALHDVYEAIDRDPEEAKFLATSIAGLLLSSKYGKTDEVYEEMVVQAAKKNMDQGLKELLSEKP
jgi:hypothetical protein